MQHFTFIWMCLSGSLPENILNINRIVTKWTGGAYRQMKEYQPNFLWWGHHSKQFNPRQVTKLCSSAFQQELYPTTVHSVHIVCDCSTMNFPGWWGGQEDLQSYRWHSFTNNNFLASLWKNSLNSWINYCQKYPHKFPFLHKRCLKCQHSFRYTCYYQPYSQEPTQSSSSSLQKRKYKLRWKTGYISKLINISLLTIPQHIQEDWNDNRIKTETNILLSINKTTCKLK
jgi:hypothetical protein